MRGPTCRGGSFCVATTASSRRSSNVASCEIGTALFRTRWTAGIFLHSVGHENLSTVSSRIGRHSGDPVSARALISGAEHDQELTGARLDLGNGAEFG
jgi:hypothetical protein